ncbi:SIR2 family NAD-dependent protein deacylase [Oerskovia paurometabola]|uniref:SIR2 family protein n=1 Tax=Oerskovia paurometabola TaxID=162170 RepID=A0ABW1X8H1_9CELL|nr:SIR2 family protein [Oerskovia paurometabola]MBM7495715.1 hypothetical protein [Oerskovia paurometabola]
MSIAAGLPSWGALLDNFVEAMSLDITPKDLQGLGSLEQAELLQVILAKQAGRHDEAARRDSQEQLGRQVAAILARDGRRPSLAHCLLAGMRIPEAVTTNYDHLYEEAVAASSGLPVGRRDLAISTLPWDPTKASRPWVLKMHGDVDHPATIVLSRSSFVRYDTRWKPVGSLVQSLMMTKHLLVVGASMTDDNLLRFAYEVAGLREELVASGAPGGLGSEIGTVVHLADDAAFSRLWEGRFDVAVASPPLPDDGTPARETTSRGEKEAEAARRRRAARGLTRFLDTVAMYAERDAPHLLDDRYLPVGPDEAALVRRLREDAHAVRQRADAGATGAQGGASSRRRWNGSGPVTSATSNHLTFDFRRRVPISPARPSYQVPKNRTFRLADSPSDHGGTVSATATENAPNDSDDTTESRVEKVAARLTALVGSVVADGVGPVAGSVEWAESRLARVQKERYDPSKKRQRNPDEDTEEIERVIKRLVIESTQAAGANGFVTGLGGLVAMPVTIPANMAGALIINARLAGAIAYLRGYDLHDPHILTMVTLVSAGSTAQQVLSAFGAKVGQQFAMEAIKAIPMSVLRQVNKKAGFFLVAKYGTQRAAITLAKVLPIVGGVVGGAVDATLTQLIARTAKSLFPRDIDDMPERKPRRRRRDETADGVA